MKKKTTETEALKNIERWLATAPTEDVERIVEPPNAESLEAGARAIKTATRLTRGLLKVQEIAGIDGMDGATRDKCRRVLRAELRYRRARRDGLNVIRKGAEVVPAKAASETPERASPTMQLEAEILRILSRDFTKNRKSPTAAEFYQEHIINGRTMAGLERAKGWKLRTMKARKKSIEDHLVKTFGITVALDDLKTAPRKNKRILPTDPHVIERTVASE